jgi:hypothetical protein
MRVTAEARLAHPSAQIKKKTQAAVRRPAD